MKIDKYGQQKWYIKLYHKLPWHRVNFNLPKRTYYNEYGRCINISLGLILGIFLDKVLFYITKGVSTLFPPLSVILLNKGKVLYKIRFEKTFHPLIEKFLISHLHK